MLNLDDVAGAADPPHGLVAAADLVLGRDAGQRLGWANVRDRNHRCRCCRTCGHRPDGFGVPFDGQARLRLASFLAGVARGCREAWRSWKDRYSQTRPTPAQSRPSKMSFNLGCSDVRGGHAMTQVSRASTFIHSSSVPSGSKMTWRWLRCSLMAAKDTLGNYVGLTGSFR